MHVNESVSKRSGKAKQQDTAKNNYATKITRANQLHKQDSVKLETELNENS